jgi:glycosyltransferase involved in cell wall biosynthesis
LDKDGRKDYRSFQKRGKKIMSKDKLMKEKEIIFVLQYFYPEVASTAQLISELAEDMVRKGIKVSAISGQPSYVKSSKLPKSEVHNGVRIERVFSTNFDKNSKFGRISNWFTYTFLVFFKLLFSRERSPLFIVSTPPFLFVVGYLLNKIQKRRYICLIYDLYPEIAEHLGYLKKGGVIGKLWQKCNKKFFSNAEYVIVPSENMRQLVHNNTGGDENKFKVIYNWSDGNFIKPMRKNDNWFSKKYGFADKLTVLYAGNMGLFHQLETLVEAAEKLKDKKIQFVFIGEGGKKKKLMQMQEEKKLENVMFLPYLDKEVLPYSLTCSDISVVSLEKGLDCVAAPCKLYTSMAAGQIILGLVDQSSDVAKIVKEYNCGFSVSQNDVDGVVDVLLNLYGKKEEIDGYSKRARKCFEENFQKEASMKRYFDIFSEVAE